MGLSYEQACLLGDAVRKEHPDSPERRAIVAREAANGSGRWTIDIPGWRPTLANELVQAERLHWRKAARLKKQDASFVAAYGAIEKVPTATRKRRVRFVIYCPRTFPDKDAPLKSLLDSLVTAKLLVDDSERWCDWEKPEYRRGPKRTVITIEDIPEGGA